uniref:Glycosyltransferase family 92 protein n=1 Tax=Globodera rostochiensis TaxID=31243 RepID=A0A914I4P8_GLORO
MRRHCSRKHYLIIQTPPFFEPNYEQKDDALPDESQLHKAFVDGVESLEYMYSSQVGKAKVFELVERPANVEELRKCYGTEPKRKANRRQWTQNGQIYVYSAYLDERTNSIFPGKPSVQVLSSSFGILPLHWAWDGTVVRARVRWIWQRAWDPRTEFYNPFLFTCPMPSTNLGNNVESLVLISRNSFCRKVQSSPNKVFLAYGQIGSSIQNCRLHKRRALGANAVTLYFYWIPPNVRNALQRMADRKQLEIVELNLPANSPNQPFIRHQFIQRNRQQKRRHELIPYNDCFNRYSATHHFVLIADIDEVVVPLRHQRWQQLLHELLARGKWRAEPSSISVRNVFKFWHNKNSSGQNANNNTENIASLFSLCWRSDTAQESGRYGKSFVNTRSIASVFNHFGLHRLHANVSNTLHVSEEDALKLHWRQQCPEEELGIEKCQQLNTNLIRDHLLDRFRDEVEEEVIEDGTSEEEDLAKALALSETVEIKTGRIGVTDKDELRQICESWKVKALAANAYLSGTHEGASTSAIPAIRGNQIKEKEKPLFRVEQGELQLSSAMVAIKAAYRILFGWRKVEGFDTKFEFENESSFSNAPMILPKAKLNQLKYEAII